MSRSFDNGVWTSELAGDRADKRRNADRVLFHLVTKGSATDDEIQIALGMPGNSERPARRLLVIEGFVVDSGETRPTRLNNPAIVWRLTPNPAV